MLFYEKESGEKPREEKLRKYFERIRSGCKPWQICEWWLFRIPMIYALIAGFFKQPFDITDPLQVFANLVGMFAWEIFMLFPEKCFLRHIPSYVQVYTVIGLFLASFGGKFLNFYYDIFWWDAVLHAFGGLEAVMVGYEVITAMQRRDKAVIKPSFVLLASLGFAFILSTGWELFEFTFDQIACVMSNGNIANAGDAQHWSIMLAQGTPKLRTVFPAIYEERWAIMDTMGDIVLNTIGSAAAYIILKICPFHHKGKYDVNASFTAEKEKAAV